MNFIRSQKMAGEGHYRVKYLMENTQGIYDELAENFYAYPALQPPMPWLDNVPPTAPSELKVTDINNGYTELSGRLLPTMIRVIIRCMSFMHQINFQ